MGQYGLNTAAYTQTDPPRGRTGPGTDSYIYDCLSFVAENTVGLLENFCATAKRSCFQLNNMKFS